MATGKIPTNDTSFKKITNMAEITKRVERIIPGNFDNKIQYLIYLRHLFAYEYALSFIQENANVLEVGCGEGYGTFFLSKHAKKVTGIDVDEDSILDARKKYEGNNCSFQKYDGFTIPFDDSSFDLIVSFQVIEHVQNVDRYLKEIKRVLKPGGTFLLTTPNRHYRLKPGQKPWNSFHLREYLPEELEKELKNIFDDAKIIGIRAQDEIQKIEFERVKKYRDAPSFSLKKLIPESLKKWIAHRISRLKKNKPNNSQNAFMDLYSTKDFYTISSNLKEESIDLLGICKK